MKTANPETRLNRSIPINEPVLQLCIEARAFELYELRGAEHGHDVDDWLQAEAEITRASRGQLTGIAA